MDENFIIEYTKKAEDIIQRYSKYKDLVKEGSVQIAEVNEALADYYKISTFLIAEYERKCTEYLLEKDVFDIWFGEKFIEVRNKHNANDLASSKWLSKQEIEMIVKKENKEEYLEKNSKLIVLDREVSTLRRILETYKKMDGVFSTLSSNQRQEIRGLSLEKRMNTDYSNNDNYNNINIRKRK